MWFSLVSVRNDHSLLVHPGTGEPEPLGHLSLSAARAGRSSASETMIEVMMVFIVVWVIGG
jgi:hypothetical protein